MKLFARIFSLLSYVFGVVTVLTIFALFLKAKPSTAFESAMAFFGALTTLCLLRLEYRLSNEELKEGDEDAETGN
jgi:hypothetical protein